MGKKLQLVIILIVHLFVVDASIAIGTPRVKNFGNLDYKAGTQTWMIDQGSDHLMYFANNDAVLQFDGINWTGFPLPGRSIVRSIQAGEENRIYAGGYNEFGYFEADERGNQVFVELQSLLRSDSKDFGEVWKIHIWDGSVIFQSFTQLMIYKDGGIDVIKADESFHFSYVVNNELFVIDQDKGILRYENGKLNPLDGAEILKGHLIWSMFPVLEGNIMIATQDGGIFLWRNGKLKKWNNTASHIIESKQVQCAIPINNNLYAFGTIQDGLVICDFEGNVKQHLNIETGLQNNTVLSLFLDRHRNLWLGLDNGIDYLEINSPLSYLSNSNNLSAGYAAVVHEGKLYCGTNQGVFCRDWKDGNGDMSNSEFQLIEGTQGQVWALEVVGGTLFCGHNSGVFVIEGRNAKMVSDVQGGWTFYQPPGRPDILICGTYTYLVRFEKEGKVWSEGKIIKGYKESSRHIVNAGQQSIWISHGYKGVYRVHFDENYTQVTKVKFFNKTHGFKTDRDITVSEVDKEAVFTTGYGLFKFDEEAGVFVRDYRLEEKLGRYDMNILQQDVLGNIWFFTTDEAGVFRWQEDGNFSEVEIPFRELSSKFIKWFQFVNPIGEKDVLIGLQSGFAHYDPTFQKDYNLEISANIRKVQILAGLDSVIYAGGHVNENFVPEIPYKFNQIQIDFSANDYENSDQIRFFTYLEGFDNDWIESHGQFNRQFTNLKAGDYIFKVKAKNIYGYESNAAAVSFSILSPWYRTGVAFFAYFLLIVGIIYFVFRYVKYRLTLSKRKFEEEQRHLFLEREKQLQIENLMAEKKLIRLKNEKLNSEKIQKDKELANTTMQILQKSKSLTEIKNDLKKLKKELAGTPHANKFTSIIKKIDRNIDSEKQWEVFESHFENVHDEFLARLKQNYPDLSPRELKLCAYLRLNISSKEISSLMNISIRGIETGRYRVRKKLGLDHDKNLTDFIISF